MTNPEKALPWEIGLISGNPETGFTQEIYCGGDSWVYVKRPFPEDAAREAFALIHLHNALPPEQAAAEHDPDCAYPIADCSHRNYCPPPASAPVDMSANTNPSEISTAPVADEGSEEVKEAVKCLSASFCSECDSPTDHNMVLIKEFRRLQAELAFMKSCGIAEVSIRNPSVMDYMKHWEGRALKAEAELERVKKELPSEAFKAGCQKNIDDMKAEHQKLFQANSQLSIRAEKAEADLAQAKKEIELLRKI